MKENLIKGVQKFINTPFFYAELDILLDKKMDFLLEDHILNNTEECEYNALWDMIGYLKTFYSNLNSHNLAIATNMSVSKIFEFMYKKRKKI